MTRQYLTNICKCTVIIGNPEIKIPPGESLEITEENKCLLNTSEIKILLQEQLLEITNTPAMSQPKIKLVYSKAEMI